MTLNQYFRAVRKRWYLVIVFVLLVAGAASAFAVSRPAVYSANTELFISLKGSADLADLTSGTTFAQSRVASYANVVTSPSVLGKVAEELGLPYSARELAGHVSAENPANTVLLDVTVTDSEPARAAEIANKIAVLFPAFVGTLETTPGKTSPVQMTVTQPAFANDSPVSPNIPLIVGFGIIVGLALGLASAVLWEQLSTRVETALDVERSTGARPLGIVPFDGGAARQPLTEIGEQNPRAEAYRTLRSNLQFMNIDDPARVVVVTSALPDEGKTTTACNLALTLAAGGASVVLIDGDLRKPSVADYLGISNAAGLTSVLVGRHELAEVLVSVKTETLFVLPSGPTPPNPSELLGSQHMSNLLANLRTHFDFIIIDAPPLLPVTDGAVLSRSADGAIIVARYGKTRREELERAAQTLRAVSAPLLGTVLNFIPVKGATKYSYVAAPIMGSPAIRPRIAKDEPPTRRRSAAAAEPPQRSRPAPAAREEGPFPAAEDDPFPVAENPFPDTRSRRR